MSRPTSRLAPTSSNHHRPTSTTHNNGLATNRLPEQSARTSPPASSPRSFLGYFQWTAPRTTSSRPSPQPQQPSLQTSPTPPSPPPPAPAQLSTENDDDFVQADMTDDVTDDVDRSDDSDNVTDVSSDDLNFMDWVYRDMRSHQKIHYLSDERYDLLMNCAEKPDFLRDKRRSIDGVDYIWAYSQLQRHTYIIQYVRDHTTNQTTAVLAEQVIDKKTNQPRFVMPIKVSEVEFRLKQLHNEIGHKGDNSMWSHMRERFSFIPRSWMRAFVRRCEVCEKRRGKQNAKPRVAVIHNRIFETHAIDFIDYSHSPDGEFKYLLHLIDNVSKMHFVQCTRTKEAAEVARFLSGIWSFTGAPLKLQSDNGGEFTAKIIQDLCVEMNVKICRSPAYDPAANGCVERANQTLERLIAKYNDVHGTTGFVAAAYKCCMIHNQTYHRTINGTPYENIFSFKPRNRSFTSALSPADFEPYSDETARIASHTRRPFTPLDDDVQAVTMTSVREEKDNRAAVALSSLADEWNEEWDPPVFDLSPTSSASADQKQAALLTAEQPNSQSPTQQVPLTAEVTDVVSPVNVSAIGTFSQPTASTPVQQSFLSTQLSLSQPLPTQTMQNTLPSLPSNPLSQVPSSAQSSDASSTPSSTESDAAAGLSTACINEIPCEDLPMLMPGMVGPIGRELAGEINVNGVIFVLVGTYASGLCTLSAPLNGACKTLQTQETLIDYRRHLANQLEHEWSDDDFTRVACFDGKQSCNTRRQFIAELRQVNLHLGVEVIRVISVILQLNIYIITNIVTRTTDEIGCDHVDVITTCELAVQQEGIDESIAVYHKFTRHVNKSDIGRPAEDSGGHYETLAVRDATSHLTYRWKDDQLPTKTLQKFLQRDNMHRAYVHRQELSQKSLNVKNNAVEFKVGEAVGVVLTGDFRRQVKSVDHNGIMNIPAVVAYVHTSPNGIKQYWVMVKSGGIIREPIKQNNLRTVVGDKSQYKSFPISRWMSAPRISVADAYSVYNPAPGPSIATTLAKEMFVPDKTSTTNLAVILNQKHSVKSVKQQPKSKTSKPPLRRLGAPHKTKSASLKSSVLAKSTTAPAKKRAPPVDAISISPVARKKPRATNVSPVPIPEDAIRFITQSGKTEIVRIDKASKPDRKIRRFHLQWYNECGGQESDIWEQDGSAFWTKEPEYGELLRQFLVAHPPRKRSPILIDDSDE